MKCSNCGGPREANDRFCIYCGTAFDDAAQQNKQEIHIHYHQEQTPHYQLEHIYAPVEKRSSRSRFVALLLCLFLGIFGVHKFYLGKHGMGILYLFTYGLFSVGWMIDLLILIFGNPKDKEGYRVTWH